MQRHCCQMFQNVSTSNSTLEISFETRMVACLLAVTSINSQTQRLTSSRALSWTQQVHLKTSRQRCRRPAIMVCHRNPWMWLS